MDRRSLLLGLGSLVVTGEPVRKAYSFLVDNPLSLAERYQTFADEFFRMMEGIPMTSGVDQYGKTYERWIYEAVKSARRLTGIEQAVVFPWNSNEVYVGQRRFEHRAPITTRERPLKVTATGKVAGGLQQDATMSFVQKKPLWEFESERNGPWLRLTC